MPKILVPNLEEALDRDDLRFESYYTEKSAGMYPRFLAELHPQDILLVPLSLDENYCNYMNRLVGAAPQDNICVLNTGLSASRLLTEATLSNRQVMQTLQDKCSAPDWYLEPFIETTNALKLAQTLHLPTHGTSPELITAGLINDFNDKLRFKDIATKAGIPVVPGESATNSAELTAKIRILGAHYPKIMLRKTKYAGGAGNLSGEVPSLLSQLPSWYNRGTVVIEPFLNIAQVAGSLVYIGDDSLEFWGIDRQCFAHGGWCGFTLPFAPVDSPEHYRSFNLAAVRDGALKLAQIAQKRGARGFMNIDWAFITGEHDRPIALECNFRHNGFGYVLEFARTYFGNNWQKQAIYCRESIPCDAMDFEQLCLSLHQLTLNGEHIFIKEPGAEKGLVITSPPCGGKVSISIFGPNQKYIDDVWELTEPVIRGNDSEGVS